jgi:PKD repeat protein
MPRIRTLSLAVVLLAIILGLSGFLGSGAGAASVQLSWTAPIVNADGTPLTDLAGYRLYYGTISGQCTVVIDVGDHASASVSGLADEQVYYFSVAAYDTLDNESPFAAEVHAGHWILPPTAGFSTTPTMGAAPLVVAFTDASTGAITAWIWDFGDGRTSGAQHPRHVYTAAGTYTVSLTVTGPGGTDDEVKVGYVTVSPSPSPGYCMVVQWLAPRRPGLCSAFPTLCAQCAMP